MTGLNTEGHGLTKADRIQPFRNGSQPRKQWPPEFQLEGYGVRIPSGTRNKIQVHVGAGFRYRLSPEFVPLKPVANQCRCVKGVFP